MSNKHHPDGSTLMSYAAGALPEALAVVTAAHVTGCGHCRERVRQMEVVGGVLMDEMEPDPASGVDVLRAVSHFENVSTDDAELNRLDDLADRLVLGRTDIDPTSEVPAALQPLIGTSLDDLVWSFLAPGVKQVKLEIKGEGDLRLLHIEPGRTMPEHGHGGSELTLVLRGAYHDETGHYKAGDIADLDDDVDHQPIVDAGQACICIIASDAKMKYKSVVGRILQPIIGM